MDISGHNFFIICDNHDENDVDTLPGISKNHHCIQRGKIRPRCKTCKGEMIGEIDSSIDYSNFDEEDSAMININEPNNWLQVLQPKKKIFCWSCPQMNLAEVYCQDDMGPFNISELEYKIECAGKNNTCKKESSPLPNIVHVPNSECKICYEDIDYAIQFACGHTCCLDHCWPEHFSNERAENKFICDPDTKIYSLRCVSNGSGRDICQATIQENHLFKILGKEKYAIYQNMAAEQEILKNGGIICPLAGCNIAYIPAEEFKTSKDLKCIHCNRWFCRVCNSRYELCPCKDGSYVYVDNQNIVVDSVDDNNPIYFRLPQNNIEQNSYIQGPEYTVFVNVSGRSHSFEITSSTPVGYLKAMISRYVLIKEENKKEDKRMNDVVARERRRLNNRDTLGDFNLAQSTSLHCVVKQMLQDGQSLDDGTKPQKILVQDEKISKYVKHCPNCDFPFIHEFGDACHHIRPGNPGGCPQCHFHFCYVCLDEWQGFHECPVYCVSPGDDDNFPDGCGCPTAQDLINESG